MSDQHIQSLIQNANEEVTSRENSRQQQEPKHQPLWPVISLLILMLISIAWNLSRFNALSAGPSAEQMTQGYRESLMILSDGIQTERSETGTLPEDLTGILADEVDVSYLKTGETSYKLWMMTPDGQLTLVHLNGQDELSLDLEE